MNNNDKGLGCLAGILFFSVFTGNIFLLSDDFEDNPIEIIMVIIAIIADIALIGCAISAAIKSFERRQAEKEQQRISEVTQKVAELINRYMPQSVITLQKTTTYNIDPQFINKEVVFSVNRLKEQLKETILKCIDIDSKIIRILSCSGCNSEDQKLEHLTSYTDELSTLKKESNLLHQNVQGKINLLNEDGNSMFFVKKAFTALLSSKKCVTESFDIKDFICEEKPAELEYFNYKYAPAIIKIGQFYYCLFSNVILVFDVCGWFASAIDPSALTINIKKKQENVRIDNNTLPNHQFIDTDSKCLKQGDIIRTWVHTCRDGSRDLMYSYNPPIVYRTDLYEYGEITISIAGTYVTMCLSSETAVNAMVRVRSEYIKKHNHRHNPIPTFLKLLSVVSEEGDQTASLITEKYKSKTTVSNYFCSIG